MSDTVHTDPSDLDPHALVTSVARRALERFLAEGRLVLPGEMPPLPELPARAGVFVSLHDREGNLRGCVGTFLPTRPTVWEEIAVNAVAAATQDPRFSPVQPEELPHLHIKVDILSPPEPVQSLDELDPRRYGILVVNGARRGLLLPDIPGVETVEQQLAIARQKAFIDSDEPAEVYRFTVRRFTEPAK